VYTSATSPRKFNKKKGSPSKISSKVSRSPGRPNVESTIHEEYPNGYGYDSEIKGNPFQTMMHPYHY